jgi:CO/xanthine dehydrogenase FAD-binding subunit
VKPEPASGSSGPSKSAAISADLMTIWKHYHQSKSVSDALQMMAASQGLVRVIAGGPDLLLDLQQGRHFPVHTLVDVASIPEMTCIKQNQKHLFIGASLPLNQVVANPLVRAHAQALVEACILIGGPQVRNTATLGGNVAHALPAADGSIALMALGAQVEIATLESRRLVPLQSVFLGPGRSALRTDQELIVGFYIPLRRVGDESAFRRVMRSQGVALPVLNLAAWMRREADRIADIRIAIGPAGPIPFRAEETEAMLRGKMLDDDLILQATECINREAFFRTSPHRATIDYRNRLARVLLTMVLNLIWERAALSHYNHTNPPARSG